NFFLGPGIEGDEPIVAPNVTFGFALGFEPWIAKLDAYRAAAVLAQPIKREASIHFREMMIGDFGGIGRLRSKLHLETERHAGQVVGVFFETKILLEDPQDVGGKGSLFEQSFPGR